MHFSVYYLNEMGQKKKDILKNIFQVLGQYPTDDEIFKYVICRVLENTTHIVFSNTLQMMKFLSMSSVGYWKILHRWWRNFFKNWKKFLVPKCSLGHTDHLYTYERYIKHVGFT